MDFDDPVNKNASHFLVDIDLFAHVAGRRLVLKLVLLHISQDWTEVFGSLLWVILIGFVYLLNGKRFDLVHSDEME